MDYRICIQGSIDYIEGHLQEEMTVDGLASMAGFSSYHYYRIFHAYVGQPVMEYVRRRRLAHAAAELARGRRIIDIALDYGFDTHNGFAKAFRKVYGCSPEMYRPHVSGQIPKKIDLFLLASYRLTGGIIVEPKIIIRPESKFAGYELKTTCTDGRNMQEIPAFWASMTAEHHTTLYTRLHTVHPNELGLCLPPERATGNFSYIIAMEVYDHQGVPPELFCGEIPAATYAVFAIPAAASQRTPDLTAAIQGTWRYIYGTWFPDSGYEFATDRPDFEHYYERTKVEICIPVIKANSQR